MRGYTYSRSNVTPVITDDVMTIVGPANGGARIRRIRMTGEAAASTVMRTVIQRCTPGSTPGGAITAEKTSTQDPAASILTAYTTWASQPTLLGNPLYVESWNAFGGGFDLVLDGREIYMFPNNTLSIRNTIGTGLLSIVVETEEL